MGIASTVYDVRVNYSTSGTAAATRDVTGLGMKAEAAGRRVEGLGSSLRSLAVTLGAGMLLGQAKSAFVDFNAQLDDMRISLSTILATQMHLPFEKAADAAGELFDRFQEAAKLSPATTKDFIEMANGISSAASQAGLSLNELHDLTVGAVTGSQAFGSRSDVAALDISQMLQGNVTQRDRFAKALLASQGLDHETFNRLNQSQRASIVKQSLSQPALKEAAKAYGQSFRGVVSTLQDTIQMGLGKVGLPVFRAITAEIRRWNEWIEKHPKEIEAFATRLSSALVSGFNLVKETAGFFVRNADTLMNLAKVWLGLKVIGGGQQSIVGLFTGALAPGRNLAATFKSLDEPAASLTGAFRQATSAMPALLNGFSQVASVLSMVYVSASAFADWLDKRQEHQIEQKADNAFFVARSGAFRKHQDAYEKARTAYSLADNSPKDAQREAMLAAQKRRDKDIFDVLLKANDEGLIRLEKSPSGVTATNLVEASAGALEATRRLADEKGMSGQEAAVAVYAANEAFRLASRSGFDWTQLDPSLRARPTVDDGKVKKTETYVHIDKVEVTSDDPDRFVHGMIEAFDVVARNPTQARAALRGL